jgi:hypothetical protein
MTAKTGVEREQKKSQNQQSLKGALAEVLSKNTPPTPPAPPTKPPTPPPVAERSPKPFEVPEEKLRKILKGES